MEDNNKLSLAAIVIPDPKPLSTQKPASKQQRPPRPHSPSPPPPPPPPPLQTVRLRITLGGPDNYAVDVASLARETGQRAPTPPRPTAVVSDTEDEPEEKDVDQKKKKKKKPHAAEYYDVSDPFIDDSELALDERTFFAQTKQTGFYVSSGEVALLKDKTPRRPPKRKPLSVAASVSASVKKGADKASGTREFPVAVPSRSVSDAEDQEEARARRERVGVEDDEESVSAALGVGDGGGGVGGDSPAQVGEKRKRYVTVVEGGKKRKIVDLASFDPQIQHQVEGLKEAISKENWDVKGKFPPTLKPLLSELALLAIRLDEYDDHFFNLMPTLFPYNKFTMTKLIKRTVFQEHASLLLARQDALLAELAELTKAGFTRAEEEWEKSVVAWDKRQEKLRLEAASAAADSTTPTRHPTEEMDVDGAQEGKEGKDCKEKDKDKEKEKEKDHPPAKRYRLTEQMKAIVWQLVLLSNECCRLENEKNSLEGSMITVSEQGSRKALYQKIVAAFPEGWMASGQISRDVSAMKKKFEKEAMEDHEQE